MDRCNTINFRWTDPNFGGNSTCYRKRCEDFATAVCTLFTKHKSRDVYTKACGADNAWASVGSVLFFPSPRPLLSPIRMLFAVLVCLGAGVVRGVGLVVGWRCGCG